jgi:hypothetical protein
MEISSTKIKVIGTKEMSCLLESHSFKYDYRTSCVGGSEEDISPHP